MEFRLDDGQLELQQTLARFLGDRAPLDALVAREGRPVDRDLWAEIAALGAFGLLLPEAEGGSGLGVIEAVLVAEQLGSHLVPGPVLWSVLAAPLVAGAADGRTLVGGVHAADVRDGAAAVEHAADLDALLELDATEVRLHRMADLGAPAPLEPLDPLTPMGLVHGLVEGEAVGDADVAQGLRKLGTVLAAGALVGIAGRALEVARAYALEREQFGVPIGSFQAVKHLLADMYVRTSLAQSATYAAAVTGDGAVAGAKLLAGDAAIANASTAVQVLGGMGFTWEMLPNHLLKRAWVLEHSFGTADEHAHAVGTALVGAA